MDDNKQREELEKDLIFYLRYYKKVAPDSRRVIDNEIKKLIETLKKL
jgi:hypothetical protein